MLTGNALFEIHPCGTETWDFAPISHRVVPDAEELPPEFRAIATEAKGGSIRTQRVRMATALSATLL